MIGQYASDLLVNFLGGAAAGSLILYVAEQVFGIRKEARRRKDDRQADKARATKYARLLRDEVKAIENWIPGQLARLSMYQWQGAIPLVSPVWHLVQHSGDLAALLRPQLLKETAWFYETLDMASRIMDFIVRSWLAPDKHVASLDDKRDQAVRELNKVLEDLQDRAPKLLRSLDDNIVLLESELDTKGQA